MIVPSFTLDVEANAYISEPFIIKERATVHIELASRAPVVTLKMEEDGGYANYGETPERSDRYEFTITSEKESTVKLATPVEVMNCFIL